jgi:acetolactate synthase-1/3 small subunit
VRHTICILVENEFGVLSRIAGMFSGRGFNIENLSVNETLDPAISRITLQTSGDETVLDQITKQLEKLISVVKVVDMSEADHVERELCLIKVAADARTRLARGRGVNADSVMPLYVGEANARPNRNKVVVAGDAT